MDGRGCLAYAFICPPTHSTQRRGGRAPSGAIRTRKVLSAIKNSGPVGSVGWRSSTRTWPATLGESADGIAPPADTAPRDGGGGGASSGVVFRIRLLVRLIGCNRIFMGTQGLETLDPLIKSQVADETIQGLTCKRSWNRGTQSQWLGARL
jgi:hypothetical protein